MVLPPATKVYPIHQLGFGYQLALVGIPLKEMRNTFSNWYLMQMR